MPLDNVGGGPARARGRAAAADDEIDLLPILAAIWRRAWLVALSALLAGAAAFYVSAFRVAPLYRAGARMYVNNSTISVGSTSVSLSDITASKSLVDTYVAILTSSATLLEVIDAAGVDYTYEELGEMIEAASVNGTEVFEVVVTSRDPFEAAHIANVIAKRVLPDRISEIVDGSSVRLVSQALVPREKSSPNVTRWTLAGLLLGGMACCGAIAASALADDLVHDADGLAARYPIPVLAAVPSLGRPNGGHGREYGYGYGYGYGSAGKRAGGEAGDGGGLGGKAGDGRGHGGKAGDGDGHDGRPDGGEGHGGSPDGGDGHGGKAGGGGGHDGRPDDSEGNGGKAGGG